MYSDPKYLKTSLAAIIGAVVAVPSIASGYYMLYLMVTAIGN